MQETKITVIRNEQGGSRRFRVGGKGNMAIGKDWANPRGPRRRGRGILRRGESEVLNFALFVCAPVLLFATHGDAAGLAQAPGSSRMAFASPFGAILRTFEGSGGAGRGRAHVTSKAPGEIVANVGVDLGGTVGGSGGGGRGGGRGWGNRRNWWWWGDSGGNSGYYAMAGGLVPTWPVDLERNYSAFGNRTFMWSGGGERFGIDDVPEVWGQGKVAIVTGANNGIGLEMSRVLAR